MNLYYTIYTTTSYYLYFDVPIFLLVGSGFNSLLFFETKIERDNYFVDLCIYIVNMNHTFHKKYVQNVLYVTCQYYTII